MHTDFGACQAMYSVSSGVLSLGVKRLDRKAGSTASYRAEVKHAWCCSVTVLGLCGRAQAKQCIHYFTF